VHNVSIKDGDALQLGR